MGRALYVGVAMKRLFSFLAALTLAAPAFAQTLPFQNLRGPLDPSQTLATLNSLINAMNGVLVPALGASASSAGPSVNVIGMTGGTTGVNANIGLQPGANPNAGITINPNGSGTIQLFGDGDTGTLKFGNQTNFVLAKTLVACPGVPAGSAAPLGVSTVVTGFVPFKDWLGRSHAWAAC